MAFGDFTVTRASTKNVLGSNGLYQSVANNVPAFEFNADGTYRGLLVEPGATNILQRSQEFDNAYWSKVASSVTANASTAPDGTTTADKLIPDATSSQHRLDVTSTSTAASHSFSVFAKADGYTGISMRAGSRAAYFSLTTGVASAVEASTTTRSLQLPNGWWRFTIAGTLALNDVCRINVETSATVGGTFTGDGTSGVLLWQAQLETGLMATSYIVTTGGTASRAADSISLTSASSLIGQTEGAIYIEAELRAITGSGTRLIGVSDGTSNNLFRMTKNNSNQVEFVVVTAGVTQAQIVSSGALTGSVVRFAGAYALNDIAFYANGTSIGTDASATIPATSVVNLGQTETSASQINGWIRAVALYTTRLSNAQLASLTTL